MYLISGVRIRKPSGNLRYILYIVRREVGQMKDMNKKKLTFWKVVKYVFVVICIGLFIFNIATGVYF